VENMGYLICKDCGGYYELRPDERPEDFEECQCGGKLQYQSHIDYETVIPKTELPEESCPEKEKNFGVKISSVSLDPKALLLSFLAIIAILFKLHVFNFLIIYLMRLNPSNSPYSSSTYLIVIIVLSVLSIFLGRYIRLR
jgi:hypothetical protein